MVLYARRREVRELLALAPGRNGAFKFIAVSVDGSVVWAAGDGSGKAQDERGGSAAQELNVEAQ